MTYINNEYFKQINKCNKVRRVKCQIFELLCRHIVSERAILKSLITAV